MVLSKARPPDTGVTKDISNTFAANLWIYLPQLSCTSPTHYWQAFTSGTSVVESLRVDPHG